MKTKERPSRRTSLSMATIDSELSRKPTKLLQLERQMAEAELPWENHPDGGIMREYRAEALKLKSSGRAGVKSRQRRAERSSRNPLRVQATRHLPFRARTVARLIPVSSTQLSDLVSHCRLKSTGHDHAVTSAVQRDCATTRSSGRFARRVGKNRLLIYSAY